MYVTQKRVVKDMNRTEWWMICEIVRIFGLPAFKGIAEGRYLSGEIFARLWLPSPLSRAGYALVLVCRECLLVVDGTLLKLKLQPLSRPVFGVS